MDKALWRVVTTLAVVGILLASYLFYNYLFQPPVQPCYINNVVNCNAITKGPISTFLGMPTSLLGLTGYIIIYFSGLFAWRRVLMGMTTFGMAFCLFLLYQEIFVLHVICPVCIACITVMTSEFFLALILNRLSVTIHHKANR